MHLCPVARVAGCECLCSCSVHHPPWGDSGHDDATQVTSALWMTYWITAFPEALDTGLRRPSTYFTRQGRWIIPVEPPNVTGARPRGIWAGNM